MGIVNVTPDSFSGDGLQNHAAAVDQALRQHELGADFIDVGGESTRPGYTPVSQEDELARVIPVINGLREASNVVISVDTRKAAVFREAVAAGADILNTIDEPSDELLSVVSTHETPIVITHNQEEPIYDCGVVAAILAYFERQLARAQRFSIKPERIILDPGIGFGKLKEHNVTLLGSLDELVDLGFPILLGASRKSFIGHLTGKPAPEREFGTAATVALAIAAGIDIIRVHDVASMLDAVKVSDAIVRGWRPHNWSES